MSQNRVRAGVPEGGQFAATQRADADDSVELVDDFDAGEPTALRDLNFHPGRGAVIDDYETGDPTFPLITINPAGDGTYQVRGEVPVDLDGYAQWRHDVPAGQEWDWIETHRDKLAAALKAGWGHDLDGGSDGSALAVVAQLNDAEHDTSDITTSLHEAFPDARAVSAGSQNDRQRLEFFDKLHQHMSDLDGGRP